jgi:hypothetical protein
LDERANGKSWERRALVACSRRRLADDKKRVARVVTRIREELFGKLPKRNRLATERVRPAGGLPAWAPQIIGSLGLVLPRTTGGHKERIVEALESLEPSGSTIPVVPFGVWVRLRERSLQRYILNELTYGFQDSCIDIVLRFAGR